MRYNQTQFQSQPQWAPAQWVLVGVGWRFLALLIDSLIIGLIAAVISAFFFPYWAFLTDAGTFSQHVWSQTPGLGGTTGLIGLTYYIIMEATRGATFGKMVLNMRVVKVDGSPIGWSESIIRNLLRIVDAFFGYLVGAILVWNSPLKQRLGDRVAHTVVIRYQG
jgi:uncharacterized RDD family membrane protein YckC